VKSYTFSTPWITGYYDPIQL